MPSALNVSLSGVWDGVLGKALAKHPDDRFQSAGEFAAAIREALALQPSGFGQSQSQSLSAALGVDEDASVVDREPAPARPVARPVDPGLKMGLQPGLPVIPVGKARRPARASVLWGAMGLVMLLVAVGAYLELAGDRQENAAPVSDQAVVPVTPPLPPGVASAPAASAVTSAATPANNDAPASAPASASDAAPAPAINMAPQAPDASTPALASAPASAVPSPLAKVPAIGKPRAAPIVPPTSMAVVPPRQAAPKPNAEQSVTRSPRCALILEKAALDEPISTDDRAFLKSSCR